MISMFIHLKNSKLLSVWVCKARRHVEGCLCRLLSAAPIISDSPALIQRIILSQLEANIRAVLPSSVQKEKRKKMTFLSDAGISFQDAAVPVRTNEKMQEEKGNAKFKTRALQG